MAKKTTQNKGKKKESFRAKILSENSEKNSLFVGRITSFSNVKIDEENEKVKVLIVPLYISTDEGYKYLGHTWMDATEEMIDHKGENMVFEAKPYQYNKSYKNKKSSKSHDFSITITGDVEYKGESEEYNGLRMYQEQSHVQNKTIRRAKNTNIEIIRAFDSGVL